VFPVQFVFFYLFFSYLVTLPLSLSLSNTSQNLPPEKLAVA
jgi:hypothetical protein